MSALNTITAWETLCDRAYNQCLKLKANSSEFTVHNWGDDKMIFSCDSWIALRTFVRAIEEYNKA